MNDFTKEDLKIILLDMDTYVEWTNTLTESNRHRELREKIQYLIDNYCEHKRTTEDSVLIQCCLDCNWSGFKS